jgi:hypothetical protein
VTDDAEWTDIHLNLYPRFARIHRDVRPYPGRIVRIVRRTSDTAYWVLPPTGDRHRNTWMRDVRVYRAEEIDVLPPDYTPRTRRNST